MGPAPGFKGDDDKTRQGSRVLGIVPACLSFERVSALPEAWFGADMGLYKVCVLRCRGVVACHSTPATAQTFTTL